jgi:hypothetical protein
MHKEKDILITDSIKKTYHGIAVGANVAAWGKTWVPEFLRSLSKPFFVDPQTYVFQLPYDYLLKEGELRKSYSAMAEKYGQIVKRIVSKNKRELNSSDFDDVYATKDFLKSTMDFQKKLLIPQTSTQKSLLEYDEILGYGKKIMSPRLQEPEFLVVPYFHFNSTGDPWYDVNLLLANTAKELYSNSSNYAVICTVKDVILQREEVDKIVEDYSNMDGIILWFSTFNELYQEKEVLKAYIQFIKRLSSKDIISMYGGYFSLLSSKFGLKGSASGTGITEHKDIRMIPTGGAQINRYYIPQAKTMSVEADARSFYQSYPAELCKCDVCSEVLNFVNSDVSEFFSRLTDNQTKEHYCLCKDADNKYIQEHSLLEISEKLKNDLDFCEEKINGIFNIRYQHLGVWLSVLEDELKNVRREGRGRD